MSKQGEEHAAVGFIKTLFGFTTESVYCCSLPNDKGDDKQATERSICDRDGAAITTFLNRWDREGRGCFGAVSTFHPGARRQKQNAVETPAFSVDLDFKSILEDEAKADRTLSACRCLPSLIVQSGHGRHPYWLLKEPLQTQLHLDRIEALQRQFADTFAGDLQVCHVAALMRLPGTHNTKGGQWWEVTVSADTGYRYEFDELEEWLSEQSPLLTRKIRPKPPEQNPYLAIAETLGFKVGVDVEQRLAAMTYQGAGEAAIHDTQRAVTSSLISRGIAVDQVVATVLDATRAAAGEYGARWNWRREELNIRKMCETWRGKIQRRDAAVERGEAVSIEHARAARAKPAPAPVIEPKGKKWHPIAKTTIAGFAERGEAILFEGKLAWHYANNLWAIEPDADDWLDSEIEQTCKHLMVLSDNRLVSEARKFIRRQPDLKAKNVAWDRHGMVPTQSGLVDPRTLELIPARPEHRVTWRVNCAWSPDATCPMWLAMLADAFSDRSDDERDATIATLQEVLGAALIDHKPRGLHKALVLVGGTNCGKSELLTVFGGIFADACIGMGLASVETPHGLMPFLQRLPWIVHEAFNPSVWHLSGNVKSIITSDPLGINMKNGPMITRRFMGPIFWATNYEPQFKESTRAMIDRMVVIHCRKKFPKGMPTGVAKIAMEAGFDGPAELILARERMGVLAWALQGLQRALANQAITSNVESDMAAETIYRDSNIVAGFVEDCVEFDSNCRVSMPDFCVAVACWFVENKGENRSSPSNESIGRALAALHEPRISTELRDNAMRYVCGVRLNAHGLNYHDRGINADLFEGKTVNTTSPGGVINKEIPISWDCKPKVMAMRAAHAAHVQKHEKELSPTLTETTVTNGTVTVEPSPSHVIDPSSEPLF